MTGPAVVSNPRTKVAVVVVAALTGAVAGTYIQKMFQRQFKDDIAMQAKRIVDEEEAEQRKLQALAASESVNKQQRIS